jgi:hypothetical protein
LNASFTFKAKIVKVGINACVPVPYRISKKLKAIKGYIPVKGTIEDHPFQQTLCPIKDSNHRLYVNMLMLKGSYKKVGDSAAFAIGQDDHPKTTSPPMPKEFKKRLMSDQLMEQYKSLTPSRQKEILKYMSFLKTEESRRRTIEKVIGQLKNM